MKRTVVDLSIITVNYNGWKDTKALIVSLQKHLSFPYELIIVDNGSKQDEAIILQDLFPSIQIIRSQINLGFAGGNNLGIKQAKGDYLLFLNNDVLLKDDSIKLLPEFLEQNPTWGGISPKILFADSPEIIQFAGCTTLSRITLRNKQIGYRERDRGQYERPQRIPYLHGAAMCIRKKVIEQIGLMPEVYFLYYEELDWCAQMTAKGYVLGYLPQARVYHKESSSTGQESPLKAYYMTRNRLLYARRNIKRGEYPLVLLYLLIFAYPKTVVCFLLRGKIKQAKAVIQGIIDYMRL
ncbi:MAG: glycosyltransferase family 2 protein [Massilibacteroides sp.]|nr:glycosyltransferase family 2 protein [Massilibacteroides sp.]